MTAINLTPPQKLVSCFGVLAFVSPEERERISSLPAGQYKTAIERLQKEISAAQKEEERQLRMMDAQVKAMPVTGARRAMKDFERAWANKLQHVSLPLQSRDGPFIASMKDATLITDRQGLYLKALAFKYRRQI